MKRSLFDASLVALVAQNLIASTPRLLISLANNSVALNVLSIASGLKDLFLSTPCPRRTISIPR